MNAPTNPLTKRIRDMANDLIYLSVEKEVDWETLDSVALNLHEVADAIDLIVKVFDKPQGESA